MTLEAEDSEFPALFAHTLRKEWGVGVFAGEKDGKRRYLFENGDERTLASGFEQMMRRVDRPTADQKLALARLQGTLASRAREGVDATKRAGWSLAKPVAKFRETYSAGFSDPDWIASARGAGGHRQRALQQAQEELSSKSLDSLLSSQSAGKLWEQVVALVSSSGLVPPAHLKLKAPTGEPLRVLGGAIRELLHGAGAYDKRFDRFVTTFTAAFGAAPSWELATAVPALFHPLDHVSVDPATFKKLLKVSSPKRSVSPRASSTGYATFLSMARLVANKLAEQGEVPRDLLDVRDFVVFTMKPTPKGRPTLRPTAPPPAREEEAAED
jgi:hypothetical protein